MPTKWSAGHYGIDFTDEEIAEMERLDEESDKYVKREV
jgi:hypothetical protein